MAARKRKPVEAGDGSYAGLVLEKFDQLELFPAGPAANVPAPPQSDPTPHGSFYPWLCFQGFISAELKRLEHKAEILKRDGRLTDQQLREDAGRRAHNEELLQHLREASHGE